MWLTDCLKVESKTPFEKWYFNEEKYRESAVKCKKLLDKFEDLRLYESRLYDKANLVCWFVSFKEIAEAKICYILHFDIRRKDIYIYFRFVDYVQLSKLKKWSWLNRNKSAFIHYKDYEESEIVQLINEYLEKIAIPFKTDKLPCRKRIPCEDQRTKHES